MADVVTWQAAEDALLDAFELLAALPDREAKWLSHGRGLNMGAWPDIVRDLRAGDYGDSEPPRRRSLNPREMARLERVLLGDGAAVKAILGQHRALVGRVLAMKLWPRAAGFGWERIWAREGGRDCGVTSDALRMRYERAVAAVAGAMTRRAAATVLVRLRKGPPEHVPFWMQPAR